MAGGWRGEGGAKERGPVGRGKWAVATLGILSCATPATAIQLSAHAEIAFAQAEWLFGMGTAVLILCAAFELRAVMRRPPGAKSWEAAFVMPPSARCWEAAVVVVGLVLAICVWLVVCWALLWNVLLPG